jgi:UPF0489 domain
MQRVLDLDLDFFLHGATGDRPFDAPRLDAVDYPPWDLEDVMAFLEERCHLLGPLPGVAVEHHGEVFGLWRDGLDGGMLQPPFHVTHVDAHADLGMGELGYMYLLSEHLALPPAERWYPRESKEGLAEAMTDGSYLAFAVAARWIADLTYVYCPGGGSDIHPYLLENGDQLRGGTIQLPYLTREQLRWLNERPFARVPNLPVECLEEPGVPLTISKASEFCAPEPFDFIFLARSPAFTPSEADPIFNAIKERFIDEQAWKAV